MIQLSLYIKATQCNKFKALGPSQLFNNYFLFLSGIKYYFKTFELLYVKLSFMLSGKCLKHSVVFIIKC